MNNSTVIGIDLAKSVFQVSVMTDGKLASNKQIRRSKLRSLIANFPSSTIAMEACYSIPAQHVKPFTRGNKTDANDAIAIIEASTRPNLRFVPIKTTHQQDIQSLHRIRERLVGNRTGLTNQTRGLLGKTTRLYRPK